MNNYIELIQDIIDLGIDKETRNGKTRSLFGREMRWNVSKSFPLMTVKKLSFHNIAHELVWFLKGRTDLRYLLERNVHIWDGDAYARYKNIAENEPEPDYFIHIEDTVNNKVRILTQEEFIERIKTDDRFSEIYGELGLIYGAQWRDWNGDTDQIYQLLQDIKNDPDSRRLMVNAWNPSELKYMTLPPCHYGFQVYTYVMSADERLFAGINRYGVDPMDVPTGDMMDDDMHAFLDEYDVPVRGISLRWNQRSVDTFLGLPYNIASYALLLELIGKTMHMAPKELSCSLGDVHIYHNQFKAVDELLIRWNENGTPPAFPTLEIKTLKQNLWGYEFEDLALKNYNPWPVIKAPLSN